MATKIRLKLTLRRQAESNSSISSAEISEDEYQVEDGDEQEDDHTLEEDDKPQRGGGKKRLKTKKTTRPQGEPENDSLTPSTTQRSSFNSEAPVIAAEKRGFVLPDQYRALRDSLTEQEIALLEKYAKSKKVVIKYTSKQPLPAFPAKPSQKGINRLERDRTTVKRPRMMGYQTEETRFDDSISSHSPPLRSHRSPEAGSGGIPPPPPPPPASLSMGIQRKVEGMYLSSPSGSEFDEGGFIHTSDWASANKSEPLILELPNLSFGGDAGGTGGNTVVVWGTMPTSSERFALNIAPIKTIDEQDPETVILHCFNPRDTWGKRYIRQGEFIKGSWRLDNIERFPITKEKQFELRIHIRPSQFLVYLDGKHLSTFRSNAQPKHLKSSSSLYLVIPRFDTHLNDISDVVINRVWWGHKEPSQSGPITSVPGSKPPPSKFHGPGHRYPYHGGVPGSAPPHMGGGNRNRQQHIRPSAQQFEEKVLHVSGIPLDSSVAYNELLRLFEHYGIEKDERNGNPRINVIEGKGFGFVTLQTPASADDAIRYLHGKPGQSGNPLSVNRARKKRR